MNPIRMFSAIGMIALVSMLLICSGSAYAAVDNDQGEVSYYTYVCNFAFEGTAYAELAQHLEGPTAVAFGIEDAVAPARIIAEFAKKAPKLEFKAGVVEGVYYDVKGIEKIALIPSRETLISKLLGSLQSPVANMARVLKQIAEKNGEAA